MAALQRFRDEQKTISDFRYEFWVECIQCNKKAVIKIDRENNTRRIACTNCGFNGEERDDIHWKGYSTKIASALFNCKLWFTASFRGETFYALNPEHLDYLQRYIASGVRENPNRTGFTMVERLPKFMQIAKNREALLKLIEKLREK
ncbi:MAG: hypothetical protein EOP46_01670 [Sphingobacteriaceae bacterium]|nr:MAG: hypothetical protein EOP46_01670 [Sphingobacteriaceae bacterium]